jgi:aquaporin related protein
MSGLGALSPPATLQPQPSFGNPAAAAEAKQRQSKAALEAKLPAFFRQKLPELDDVETATEASLPMHGGKRHRHHHHHHRFHLFHRQRKHDAMVKKELSRRVAAKNIIVAAVAEFIGTFFFLFFALAINTTCVNVVAVERQANTAQSQSTNLTALLVSSLGFGFSLAISAWVFYRVSGGVQNPAITVALTLTGALSWVQCIVLTIVQYAGGIVASYLISGLYPGAVNSRTQLSPTTTVVQGFFFEFFLTVLLIFTVLMLAAEKHRATFLAPVGIGLALFITQLLGQPYTGASVNPARTLGPDVAQRSFDGYCWIYYAAPYAAAIVTSAFYGLLKWVRYETAAEQQDGDAHTAGNMRQVVMDPHGNVIGSLDIISQEEYNAHVNHDETAPLVAPHVPQAHPLASADHTADGATAKHADLTASQQQLQQLYPSHLDLESPMQTNIVVPSQPMPSGEQGEMRGTNNAIASSNAIY